MNKERNVIEPNAIVVFDGDVKVSKLNQLFKNFQGDIIITGRLLLDREELSIECNNLYVMGEITFNHKRDGSNDIWVRGNLYVENSIDCMNIVVEGNIYCMGSINSFNIEVAEDLYVRGKIDTNGSDIHVGGELICIDRVEASNIVVLQKIYVLDTIEANSISVG